MTKTSTRACVILLCLLQGCATMPPPPEAPTEIPAPSADGGPPPPIIDPNSGATLDTCRHFCGPWWPVVGSVLTLAAVSELLIFAGSRSDQHNLSNCTPHTGYSFDAATGKFDTPATGVTCH
jgi:hypothetical protein